MAGGLAQNHVMRRLRHALKNRQKPRRGQNQKQRKPGNQTGEENFLFGNFLPAKNHQCRERNQRNCQRNRAFCQKSERDGNPAGQVPCEEFPLSAFRFPLLLRSQLRQKKYIAQATNCVTKMSGVSIRAMAK